jgi:undecaprenyl-diphosphatase
MTIHPMSKLDAAQRTTEARRDQQEIVPGRMLLGWAILATTVATGITAAVYAGAAGPIDTVLFDAVHVGARWTPANSPGWWNEAVRDVTSLGGTVVLTGAVIAVAVYLWAAARYRLSALLVSSAISATLFSGAIKLLLARARPDSIGHLVETTSASFPSGHALLSAAILLTVGGIVAIAARKPSEKRVIWGTAVLLTLGVGLSRVWLGVHWPSDVAAGWLFGSSWAALTLWLAMRIERSRERA